MLPEQVNWDSVFLGGDFATMVPGGVPYGIMRDAALAIEGERIAWLGPASVASALAAQRGIPVYDAAGLCITPGLIDCHTHLVYGGNRASEFEQRLLGVSYEQIARAGGGIQSTVRATRARRRDRDASCPWGNPLQRSRHQSAGFRRYSSCIFRGQGG